jgi:putative transposase
MLANVVLRFRWSCLAYCLMNNHVHLLLETWEANLSQGMQRLHGGYAQAFNARRGRAGHVFQGRYGAVRMRATSQVWLAATYIARNPVEAGLCRRPDEWPWSSYGGVTSERGPAWLDTDRLLSYFDPSADAAREAYLQMTAMGFAESKGV